MPRDADAWVRFEAASCADRGVAHRRRGFDVATHPFSSARAESDRLLLAAAMMTCALALALATPITAHAAPDGCEPDDTPAQASVILVDGTIQDRTIDPVGDYDYVKFDAVSGHRYIIENGPPVSAPGQSFDMGLWLYDADGTTLIDFDDDSGVGSYSRIDWTALANAPVYVRTGFYEEPGTLAQAYRLRVTDVTDHGGASIEGSVTSGGAPLEGVTVKAIDDFYGTVNAPPAPSGVTEADGSYSFATEMDGVFRVKFEMVGYRSQYFDAATDRAAATPLTLTGVTVGDVDAALDAMAPPTRITCLPELVSVDSAGVQGELGSWSPSLSRDGLCVAFASDAANLVEGDANDVSDVFVRYLDGDRTVRVSTASYGTEGNGGSWEPALSADAHVVAFSSDATNLVPTDTNEYRDIFLKDLASNETTRVSVAPDGAQADADCFAPAVSADGRYVVLETAATNLTDRSNGFKVIVRKDLQSGETTIVSQATDGTLPDGISYTASISGDGRFVVFTSDATNLVVDDTNAVSDVFLRDCLLATTTRVSVSGTGAQGGGASSAGVISGDGTHVGFVTGNDLVADDTNGEADVYVCATGAPGALARANVASDGTQADSGLADGHLALSDEGRWVAFESDATNLVPGYPEWDARIYLHDTLAGSTGLVSASSGGWWPDESSWDPAISGDGSRVAFDSGATNLVESDGNDHADVFAAARDVSPPETTSDAVAGYASPAVITLTAIDAPEGGSGVATTTYTLDGGPETTYTGPISVTALGTHTLRFWSVDVAGNVEAANQVVFGVGEAATLGRPVSAYTVRHGARLTVYGTLRPKHRSRTYPVSLRCYRLEGGEWVLHRTFRARAYYGPRVPKYAQWIRLPDAGRWKIVAVHMSNGFESSSAPRYLRVW
jgi:Tol biopolymer transport system component